VFVLSKKRRRKEESTEHKVRMPMEGEVFGIVIQLLGYDRVRVECDDGYTRVCRIPGKMKKRVWIREGDVVLVAPWDFQFETRGDITWRYTKNEARWLREKGYLKVEEI